MLEAHDAPAADVQQVADLEDERVLVHVQATVRVSDFPEQPDDARFFFFVETVVQELGELVK